MAVFHCFQSWRELYCYTNTLYQCIFNFTTTNNNNYWLLWLMLTCCRLFYENSTWMISIIKISVFSNLTWIISILNEYFHLFPWLLQANAWIALLNRTRLLPWTFFRWIIHLSPTLHSLTAIKQLINKWIILFHICDNSCLSQ